MSLLTLQLQWFSIARACDTMQNECFVTIYIYTYRAVWKTFCIHAALCCCCTVYEAKKQVTPPTPKKTTPIITFKAMSEIVGYYIVFEC